MADKVCHTNFALCQSYNPGRSVSLRFYYSFHVTGNKDTFTIGDFDDLTLTAIINHARIS